MAHPPIKPGRFAAAEQQRTLFTADIPVAATREDILEPQFWAHVSREMKSFDIIEARGEDGSFWAQLLVVRASPREAVVRLINYVDLDPTLKQYQDLELDGMIVSWKGAHDKFVIIRAFDKKVIKGGLPSRSAAIQEAIQYSKNLAA